MDSNIKLVSLLKGVLNATPDIIFAKDASFTYISCNKAFAKLIGQPVEQIIGSKDEELFDDENIVQWFREADKKILATQEIVRLEEWVTYPDGKKVLLDTLKSPFYDESGKLIGLLGVCRDVTERVEAENLLKAAKEKAEKATAAKSDFLAKMSHEIRTPMNAVIGLSRLTLKTHLNCEQTDYVEKILSAGEALLGLINDILDFSKIEAGKLSIEKTLFDLDDIMAKTINISAINAHSKGLELITNISNSIPHSLVGDPLRLQQILINLVNNAIKFTDKGTVCIEVAATEETKDDILLQFTITDTGIGMCELQQEKLFQSFSQADDSMTRKYGGTGLGLAISKQLTQLMGGEINIKSKQGAGSTFSFTVLLGKSKQGVNKPTISADDFNTLKVLVVDDAEIARVVLVELLSQWGLTVEQCDNGFEAIDKIQTAQYSEQAFDIILMDWRMPEIDGIETSKKIMELPLKTSPQILMVSAFDRDLARESAEKSNVIIHQYLEKPVNKSTLSTAIRNVLLDRPDKILPSKWQDEVIPDFSRAKILLVDDNAINRQVALGFLKDTRAQVDIAENGVIALEKVQLNNYDLVLMDIQMPEMDGLTATKIIKNELNLATLPVIAMTAQAMADDVIKSQQAGMCDHLSKPISPEQLYQCIMKHLVYSSVVRQNLTDKNQTLCHYQPKKHDNKVIAQLEKIQILTPEQALKKMGGRTKLYLSLVRDFYKSQGQTVANLSTINEKTDLDLLYRTIHTLKSNAAYIGAYELVRLCNAFELSLEKNAYPSSILATIVQSLTILLQQLSTVFNQDTKQEKTVHFSKVAFCEMLTAILPKLHHADFSAEELLPDLQLLVTNSQYCQQVSKLSDFVNDVEYVQAVEIIEKLLEDVAL
jgi:two-component system sensor histidine kinase/response regulator